MTKPPSSPPNLNPPPFIACMVVVALLSAALILILLLPNAWGAGILVLALVGVMGIAARRTGLNLSEGARLASAPIRWIFWRGIETTLPASRVFEQSIPRWLLVIEFTLCIAVALVVTAPYGVDDPNRRLPGTEAEWLTSSVQLAANSLRKYGYIPLWQPWIGYGEPLIDGPFSFLLNPLSSAPGLILGGVRGVRLSVVLHTILAGAGGWFLARVLGLSSPGRILLALLMIGKGNMHAMIGTGYFQLGVSQAYMPWIIGAALAILRARRRWPIILMVVMFTLMFWAGNIWYTLPTLVAVILLGVLHSLGAEGKLFAWNRLRRLLLAGILTLGLSAALLLPIFFQRQHIGGHPDEQEAGWEIPRDQIIPLYFDSSLEQYPRMQITGIWGPGMPQFYYTYIAPLWFVIFLLLIPPLYPWLHRPGVTENQRVWVVAVFLAIMATLWGAGGHPIFISLYNHVPLLGQWRFVGRALAVGSFWIAVLIALRFDGLFRAVTEENLPRWLKIALASILLFLGGYAAYQLNAQWSNFNTNSETNTRDAACLGWLRQQRPHDQLTVYRWGYNTVTPFIDNEIRLPKVEADYFPEPIKSTLGRFKLIDYGISGEYGVAWFPKDRVGLSFEGYRTVPESPILADGHNCLWRDPYQLPYAYALPLGELAVLRADQTITFDMITPIQHLNRWPDRIAFRIQGNRTRRLVVTLQEVAYPGWMVEVDGKSARLESVGGQIGVIIPAGAQTHTVFFAYRPPLFFLGAAITLITAAISIAYLLHLDRWRIFNRRQPAV